MELEVEEKVRRERLHIREEVSAHSAARERELRAEMQEEARSAGERVGRDQGEGIRRMTEQAEKEVEEEKEQIRVRLSREVLVLFLSLSLCVMLA